MSSIPGIYQPHLPLKFYLTREEREEKNKGCDQDTCCGPKIISANDMLPPFQIISDNPNIGCFLLNGDEQFITESQNKLREFLPYGANVNNTEYNSLVIFQEIRPKLLHVLFGGYFNSFSLYMKPLVPLTITAELITNQVINGSYELVSYDVLETVVKNVAVFNGFVYEKVQFAGTTWVDSQLGSEVPKYCLRITIDMNGDPGEYIEILGKSIIQYPELKSNYGFGKTLYLKYDWIYATESILTLPIGDITATLINGFYYLVFIPGAMAALTCGIYEIIICNGTNTWYSDIFIIEDITSTNELYELVLNELHLAMPIYDEIVKQNRYRKYFFNEIELISPDTSLIPFEFRILSIAGLTGSIIKTFLVNLTGGEIEITSLITINNEYVVKDGNYWYWSYNGHNIAGLECGKYYLRFEIYSSLSVLLYTRYSECFLISGIYSIDEGDEPEVGGVGYDIIEDTLIVYP